MHPQEAELSAAGFRAGIPGAAESLISSSLPLIGKYVRMLLGGPFDDSDVELREFLGGCDPVWFVQGLRAYDPSEVAHVCRVALLDFSSSQAPSSPYALVLRSYIEPMLEGGWEFEVKRYDRER